VIHSFSLYLQVLTNVTFVQNLHNSEDLPAAGNCPRSRLGQLIRRSLDPQVSWEQEGYAPSPDLSREFFPVPEIAYSTAGAVVQSA